MCARLSTFASLLRSKLFTDFHETWYELHATGGHPVILNFLQLITEHFWNVRNITPFSVGVCVAADARKYAIVIDVIYNMKHLTESA
jgi:hypothetical protein